MVHGQPVSGGKAMDYTCSPRSRVTSHFWGVFWQRQFFTGRRRLPPGALAGEEHVADPTPGVILRDFDSRNCRGRKRTASRQILRGIRAAQDDVFVEARSRAEFAPSRSAVIP